jgi:methionyl-tRNA formyltransferase
LKPMKRVIVITDNCRLYKKFKQQISHLPMKDVAFTYYCSPGNRHQFNNEIDEISIHDGYKVFIEDCCLVLSLHCQQVFPAELIDRVRCVNIHPGLNPHNRGWYPHIFCIMNGKPAGATIHEIDYKIDHGPIIASKQVEVLSWDTSESLYERIQEAELLLIEENLENIIHNTYTAIEVKNAGNLNSKNDFKNLCRINMQEQGTFEQFYNTLRALSYTGYNNAWFIDKDGNKVYLNLKIEKGE